MSAEFRQLETIFFKYGKDARHRSVQFADGELMLAGAEPMGLNAGNFGEYSGVNHRAPMHGEFYNLVASHRRDEFFGRPHGDDAAMIHYGDSIAEPLRLFHIVRCENDGSACHL